METRWQSMCRYVGFGPDDSARLAALLPVVEGELGLVAEAFYDGTREHEEAHAVFTDEAQIERLKRSMQAWLGYTLRGPHDEAYFQRASHIGNVHVRIGLAQRYMLLASQALGDNLCELARSKLGVAAGETCVAIRRILELGLTAMLETYTEDRLGRARRAGASEVAVGLEAQLTDALDLVDVLVVGIDGHDHVRVATSAVTRVAGFERQDLLGSPFVGRFVECPGPADRDRVEQALSRAREHGRATLEGRLRTATGRVRLVQWDLTAAPSDDGAEERVELWALGRDRTVEVEQAAQSRRTERLATLGTLAAGLAHEIRNPLNGAALHLKFLERQLERHAQIARELDVSEAVGVVKGEITRLSKLVSEFLLFARPHALERHEVDIRDVVRRVVTLVLPEANQHGIDLMLDVPRTPLKHAVDAEKLEQVLVNLIKNAIEALAPGGRGKVIARVRRKPSYALIEVIDDGPGLAQPNLPIFDPFITTKATGSGLGLPIAHRIIADHGGRLSCESEPGHTVFAIELPLAAEKGATEP